MPLAMTGTPKELPNMCHMTITSHGKGANSSTFLLWCFKFEKDTLLPFLATRKKVVRISFLGCN